MRHCTPTDRYARLKRPLLLGVGGLVATSRASGGIQTAKHAATKALVAPPTAADIIHGNTGRHGRAGSELELARGGKTAVLECCGLAAQHSGAYEMCRFYADSGIGTYRQNTAMQAPACTMSVGRQ